MMQTYELFLHGLLLFTKILTIDYNVTIEWFPHTILKIVFNFDVFFLFPEDNPDINVKMLFRHLILNQILISNICPDFLSEEKTLNVS